MLLMFWFSTQHHWYMVLNESDCTKDPKIQVAKRAQDKSISHIKKGKEKFKQNMGRRGHKGGKNIGKDVNL